MHTHNSGDREIGYVRNTDKLHYLISNGPAASVCVARIYVGIYVVVRGNCGRAVYAEPAEAVRCAVARPIAADCAMRLVSSSVT